MSVAACLLAYSVAVLVLGPPLLRSLTRSGFAPRLEVAAWLTAIGSVLLAWLAALTLSIAQAIRSGDQRRGIFESCMTRMLGIAAGDAGITPQIALLALVVSASVAAVVAGARLAATLTRMHARAREHADAVRIVGHHTGTDDVVVVDAAKPAAYAVSGRPPAIVVTSAAVAALDERQLAAVLAHERAHLSGNHWFVVSALRSLARVFPRLALMRQGAQHVSLLLEMRADDVAARHHDPAALLSGLITLSGAAPAGALAAADVAVLTRAERLTRPQTPPEAARAALTASIAVMAAAPLVITALAASGAAFCGC